MILQKLAYKDAKIFSPCGLSDQLAVRIKKSFAPNIKIRDIFTRSFASRF
jgi:hypothetical protein